MAKPPTFADALLPHKDGRSYSQPHLYRSHKFVRAVRISGVAAQTDGGALLALDDNFAPFRAESAMVIRYMPVEGDYLVIYENGYKSLSPRKAFQEGYDRAR